jgi:hypothetical protein
MMKTGRMNNFLNGKEKHKLLDYYSTKKNDSSTDFFRGK